MYCTECGANIADTAKFCTECGHPVQPRPAVSTQPPVSDEPTAAPSESAVFTAPAAPQPEPPAWETPAAPNIPPQSAATRPPRRYRGRLVLAVLACFLLFVPTGIPAIVYAAKAIRASDAGEAETAKRAAKKSTLFFFLSILGNIVWNLIGLLLLIKKYL